MLRADRTYGRRAGIAAGPREFDGVHRGACLPNKRVVQLAAKNAQDRPIRRSFSLYRDRAHV
jgi:hypothetical protein